MTSIISRSYAFAQGMLKGHSAVGETINIEPSLTQALLQIDTYYRFVFSNKKSHRSGSRSDDGAEFALNRSRQPEADRNVILASA